MLASFSLPRPPSTNKLYINPRGNQIRYKDGRRTTPGRLKSQIYKAWIEEAGWKIKAQLTPIPRFMGPVTLTIASVAKIDIDNIKAIPDLLKTMGMLGDDKQIEVLIVMRGQGPDVQVTVSDALSLCQECAKNYADPPSKLCPGCEAYQGHR